VECQRRHWSSHKRQCRALAEDEICLIVKRCSKGKLLRMWSDPNPSDVPMLLKFSAITWTTRTLLKRLLLDAHFDSLHGRGILLEKGRPAPGDTQETLARLFKRASTELPWPELPGGTKLMFDVHLEALSTIARLGEPEAAVEILSRHVEDVESKVLAPNYMAKYYLLRLDWLLAAAEKFQGDEGRKDAYVTEAKGVMGRATRSLRDFQSKDWDGIVSNIRPAGHTIVVA
jgi:hypothetical protein